MINRQNSSETIPREDIALILLADQYAKGLQAHRETAQKQEATPPQTLAQAGVDEGSGEKP